jgi:hypothetical protein
VKPALNRRQFVGSLAVLPGILGLSCAHRSPSGAEPVHAIVPGESFAGAVDAGRGEGVLSFRGRTVFAYAFGAGQYKPYVRELYTLRGENVLRDAPADHLHHHGLMYAVRVNGVNFWEERPPAGRQVSAAPPVLTLGATSAGLPEAVLVHDILWQPSGNDDPGAALLRERREIRLTVNAGSEEVALEWRAAFAGGPAADRLVLHGPDYHGLGLRLPAEFDHVAEFRNSARLSYSEAQTFDVRPAAWTAAAGRMAGKEVQVVLASHPGNPGRQSFFSMRNAFAYLAATPEPSREPLSFPREARFEFRYLLLVQSAHQNSEYLDRRFAPWLAAR